MASKNIAIAVGVLALSVAALYVLMRPSTNADTPPPAADPTPRPMSLSGTYECLPHKDTSGPVTMECAFGIKADDGSYYAVNFGESAEAMGQFEDRARVSAEGFFVPVEALSSDQWQKYDIEGIFTVTAINDAGAPQGKLDIAAVCQSALAYMTFPDGAAADAFVAECIEGKHPEVIERYKADMGISDDAAI